MAEKKHLPTYLIVISYCVAVFVGAAGASVIWHNGGQKTLQTVAAQIKPLRQKNNPYQYINPLLGYEVPGNIKEFNDYEPLRHKITEVINQNIEHKPDSYAIYFRDITLGRWSGVNEDTAYAPASMMKVVIMIAYFKQAETDPNLLEKTYTYSSAVGSQINEVPFETPSELQINKSYTVRQLIDAMIINSDNGAKNVLLDNLNQNNLDEIYTDLGLPNPSQSDNYLITPKQFSLLLRVLYNGNYLSRQYSELALQIMSQAKYNEGLVSGLPTGTTVAQKFGENISTAEDSLTITLSNCGIIYHPGHPYILCVMTKGSDLSGLTKTIVSISRAVWEEVDSYANNKK